MESLQLSECTDCIKAAQRESDMIGEAAPEPLSVVNPHDLQLLPSTSPQQSCSQGSLPESSTSNL